MRWFLGLASHITTNFLAENSTCALNVPEARCQVSFHWAEMVWAGPCSRRRHQGTVRPWFQLFRVPCISRPWSVTWSSQPSHPPPPPSCEDTITLMAHLGNLAIARPLTCSHLHSPCCHRRGQSQVLGCSQAAFGTSVSPSQEGGLLEGGTSHRCRAGGGQDSQELLGGSMWPSGGSTLCKCLAHRSWDYRRCGAEHGERVRGCKASPAG